MDLCEIVGVIKKVKQQGKTSLTDGDLKALGLNVFERKEFLDSAPEINFVFPDMKVSFEEDRLTKEKRITF